MTVVVSDTSPIRALDHLGLLDILPELFGRVLVPHAVVAELQRGGRRFRSVNVSDFPFFEVLPASDVDRVNELLKSLQRGEAEAIVLAGETHADELLIDENDGRMAAKQLGLAVVGTIGVLLRAKAIGKIVEIRPLLDSLQIGLGFHISPAFRSEALRLADESP